MNQDNITLKIININKKKKKKKNNQDNIPES